MALVESHDCNWEASGCVRRSASGIISRQLKNGLEARGGCGRGQCLGHERSGYWREISCLDDDLPTVKSGDEDFARWVKGQPRQQIGNHRRERDYTVGA